MIEQLTNVSARHAANEALSHRRDRSFGEDAHTTVQTLIRQIESWSASHSTAERLSILASAWKRLAIVEACCSDAARVRSHLKQAVKCYVKAVGRSTRNKSYPLSQAALARLLSGWTSRAVRMDAQDSIDQLAKLVAPSDRPGGFWDLVQRADLGFLQALSAIAAGAPGPTAKQVAEHYHVAIHRSANRLQRRSVAETFDCAIVVLETYPQSAPGGAKTRAALAVDLVRDLCALLGFAAPPARAAAAPASPRPETSSRPAGDDHPVPPAE
jgi:hypothetical protein